MQCWKLVLCAAVFDSIGVIAFIRHDSDSLSSIDRVSMNSSEEEYMNPGRRMSISEFTCLNEGEKSSLSAKLTGLLPCTCVVACNRAKVDNPDESFEQHEYICLSSMCEKVMASKDGWAYGALPIESLPEEHRPLQKLFWSKNSWMTAPKAVINDQFPDQTSKADTWYEDLKEDLKKMNSMIGFMKVVADKLLDKGISLYLDFCDVNPVCHGFEVADEDKWKPNQIHQKLVMHDLAQGVIKADGFLPNKGSGGAYCGAEFAKAQMLETEVVPQVDAKLFPGLTHGSNSYADMVMEAADPEAKLTQLVNTLAANMNERKTGKAASEDIEGNFDKATGNPRNKPSKDAEIKWVDGRNILRWAKAVLNECDGACKGGPTKWY